MSLLPSRLVRFFGNTDYAIECVALKEITAVHVSLLNDPFDPNLTLVTEFKGDYNKFKQEITKTLSKDQGNYDFPTEESFNKALKSLQKYFDEVKEKLYIFSCFVPLQNTYADNLYMWGHYGNGHRGVAIEFDTNILDNFLRESLGTLETKDMARFFEIQYFDDLPSITSKEFYEQILKIKNKEDVSKTAYTNKFYQMLRCKHKKTWGQENEWRCMINVPDKTALKIKRYGKLPEKAITRVYLGCNISEPIARDISFEIKRNFPDAEVLKGEKQYGKFALNFNTYTLQAS